MIGLVALVASVGVALFALPDPGYVLIGFGKYSLETTLLVFVVVLAVAYVSLRMLAGLWYVDGRTGKVEHGLVSLPHLPPDDYVEPPPGTGTYSITPSDIESAPIW